MGGHGQAAWPLILSPRLCIVVLLLPGGLRADPLMLKAAGEFASAAAALEPVNWVMAQADLGVAARRALEPQAAAPVAAPERSRNALMRLFFQDSSEERPLQVAPIRWRGNAGFEQRLVASGDGSRRSQSIEFSNLQMSSYIGQPWLVQVRANLGVLAQQQRAAGEVPDGGAPSSERSASLTGGASVAVFPTSRFPFTASFESNDSRASGEATGADFVSRMLMLRQSYRSPLGDQLYAASLDRSLLISPSFGRDSVTALSGTLRRTFPLQTLDASGSYAQNRRSPAGDGSDVSQLGARHSYRPSDLVTVDSYASFSMSGIAAGATDLRSRFMQVNSFATWRPDEESPLYVTGGLRMADANSGSGDTSAAARIVGANLAMSYALTEHATLAAAGSVNHIGADGNAGVFSSQSLAASYSPPPIPFGRLNYSWNTSASAANQTGGIEGRGHRIGLQGNHQASTGIPLGSAASVNASINQGVGVLEDSLREPTVTVTHSATFQLRMNPHAASDAVLSMNIADSQARGGREDRFRLLNLQLSGQLQLGVYSLASANFTLQATRQVLSGEEDARTTVQRSGTLNYQHMRLFGMRRLRFVLSASFNEIELESRLLGDPNAPRNPATRLLEARLQYDIGRLDFRLGTRLATLEGKADRQLFFRVNRQFGLY